MPTTTPRRVNRAATWICGASALLALATTIGYAARVLPFHSATMVVIVFVWFLGTACASAVTAAVAHCQAAVGTAFAAGLRAGQAMQLPVDFEQRRPVERPGLRVVE